MVGVERHAPRVVPMLRRSALAGTIHLFERRSAIRHTRTQDRLYRKEFGRELTWQEVAAVPEIAERSAQNAIGALAVFKPWPSQHAIAVQLGFDVFR
jgi:hypothetical protein